MIDSTWIYGALWLGLLTAISPCPLAANLAAIGFLGRDRSPWRVLAGGLLYTAGRSLAYVGLALLLSWGLLGAPALSRWLQTVLNPLLGPLLILTGMALLGWLPLPSIGSSFNTEGWKQRITRGGLISALPMGMALALAFCPVSAALYFGSLLPLALSKGHIIAAPVLYGIGTALPVVGFTAIIAWSVHRLGKAFAIAEQLDRWLRPATASFLIGLGLVLLWTRIWAPLLGLTPQ